jgi:disulfide bond formation protein DsbB
MTASAVPGPVPTPVGGPAPPGVRTASAALALAGWGSLAALAVALVSQHGFGIEPCAWCVIQRVVVIAVAAAALTGAWAVRRSRTAALTAVGAVLALAVGGAVAAWHQHTVASRQLSCAFTWADRTLMDWQLDRWLPSVFRVGATCADAAQSTLLGLPYEVWSGTWFAIVAVLAAAAAVALLRTRRG